jgi:hypothetical protein
VSCNKDQAAVKKLDGTWNASQMNFSESGLTFDLIGLGGTSSFTFNNCKLKKDEWCSGSNTLTMPELLGGETETTNYEYRVLGDGTQLEIKDSDTTADTRVMTIVTLTKSELEFNYNEDGTIVSVKASK